MGVGAFVPQKSRWLTRECSVCVHAHKGGTVSAQIHKLSGMVCQQLTQFLVSSCR